MMLSAETLAIKTYGPTRKTDTRIIINLIVILIPHCKSHLLIIMNFYIVLDTQMPVPAPASGRFIKQACRICGMTIICRVTADANRMRHLMSYGVLQCLCLAVFIGRVYTGRIALRHMLNQTVIVYVKYCQGFVKRIAGR